MSWTAFFITWAIGSGAWVVAFNTPSGYPVLAEVANRLLLQPAPRFNPQTEDLLPAQHAAYRSLRRHNERFSMQSHVGSTAL